MPHFDSTVEILTILLVLSFVCILVTKRPLFMTSKSPTAYRADTQVFRILVSLNDSGDCKTANVSTVLLSLSTSKIPGFRTGFLSNLSTDVPSIYVCISFSLLDLSFEKPDA